MRSSSFIPALASPSRAWSVAPSAARTGASAIPLGDLSLGEQAEVVVELAAPSSKNGANVEVLDAVLRYEDGVGGAQREERIFVGARSTDDAASLAQGHVKTVEDAFARAKDAAATLENRGRPKHAKRKDPQPPDALPGEPGAPSAAPPRAAADEKQPSPEEQRQAHDKAIRNFQSY